MTPIRVEVATLSLSAHDAPGVAALAAWLDGPESARAASFVSPVDRQLYVAAHALARMLLCAVGGRAPSCWSFSSGPDGKPRARDSVGGPAPVFSLSHTRHARSGPLCGVVGVAATMAAGCELGFDLEVHDPTVVAEDFGAVLSPHEAAHVQGLPDPLRPDALARLWCLKEAFAKATGEGLQADLPRIGFDGPDHAVRLNAATAAPDGPWHLEHRVDPDGTHAALAVRHPPAAGLTVTWHRWTLAGLQRELHAPSQGVDDQGQGPRPAARVQGAGRLALGGNHGS